MGEWQTARPFELRDEGLLRHDCYIHGKWVPARRRGKFPVIDPGSGNVWAECADGTTDDIEPAVHSAHIAFESYSTITPRHRAQLLLKRHQLIDAARDDLAKILVHETGKPLAEAYGEIDYALSFVWWFMGEADRIQGSTITSALPGRRSIVIKQPIGVVAGLVPWNFPIALMLRKASAALAAGCTMAGLPPGVLNVVPTSLENTPMVAEALCLHPVVKRVTFTGSTRVGKTISGLCTRDLKKATFELGGNCPFVVFDDANLEQAVDQLMALKWRHAGQACITANRVYVQDGIHDVFVQKLVDKVSSIQVGHGMAEDTTMGAVTTARGLDHAEELVKDATSAGAKLISGSGQRLKVEGYPDGYYMAPTILTNMADDMFMSCEENFAPILGIYVFDTETEVVRRANDTSMGLTSYVFTKDVDRLWRLFENLEAGMIGLTRNTGNCSAAEAPFGGIKDSGSGKENGKDIEIDEFMIIKTGTLTVEEHY
ncbi:Aldehyde/histidinol dehydrogenase [Xylariales sp. AK1849]|nr:Aldehyde/histidinol dehydrogenase [Xylariales sp. AK1849]